MTRQTQLNRIRAGLGIMVILVLLMPAISAESHFSKESGDRYHVRLMRVRFDAGNAGSALFKPDEIIVPLSDREIWGLEDQIISLREALGADEIEPIPGLIVAGGLTPRGQPHSFMTALGNSLVELSIHAERVSDGWHRIQLAAVEESGEEILDTSLLVRPSGTVAVLAPLLLEGEALILGVTPMAPGAPFTDSIHKIGEGGVTPPQIIAGSRVQPAYPAEAKKNLRSGKVILESVIRRDGVPDRIVVLRMPEGGERLAGNAVEAFSQWRYEPALLNGTPVDVLLHIVINYQFEQGKRGKQPDRR
jgi:TonB family protein